MIVTGPSSDMSAWRLEVHSLPVEVVPQVMAPSAQVFRFKVAVVGRSAVCLYARRQVCVPLASVAVGCVGASQRVARVAEEVEDRASVRRVDETVGWCCDLRTRRS